MTILQKKITLFIAMLLTIGAAMLVPRAYALWDEDNILTQVIYNDETDNEVGLDLGLNLEAVDLGGVSNQEVYRGAYGLSNFASGTAWGELKLAFVGRGPSTALYFSTALNTAPGIGATSFAACSSALTAAVQGGYETAGTNPAVIAASNAAGNSYFMAQNSGGNAPGLYAGLNAGYADGQYGEISLSPLATDGGYVDMYLYRVDKSGRTAVLTQGSIAPYVAVIRLKREGSQLVTILNPDGAQSGDADADGDGVVDENDMCPNTPAGATVDESGCSAAQRDLDGDGYEGDMGTGADCNDGNAAVNPGATEICGDSIDNDCDGSVDEGCTVSTDDDGDGVLNGADLCPNTPTGTQVDATGCPVVASTDNDGDGVLNGADLCPNTPTGTQVDATGCPVVASTDDDGDGVLNSADLCPNTPTGTKVDTTGCPVSSSSGSSGCFITSLF